MNDGKVSQGALCLRAFFRESSLDEGAQSPEAIAGSALLADGLLSLHRLRPK